jgi:hypothetical protein
MTQLLAALDDSAATAPVTAVARWFGNLFDLEVLALHVSEDGSGTTAFGFHGHQPLVALAMLALGAHPPRLPGRT